MYNMKIKKNIKEKQKCVYGYIFTLMLGTSSDLELFPRRCTAPAHCCDSGLT